MPEEKREVIVTDGNGSNAVATILGAIIIAAAVIFAIWYFASQSEGGEEETPQTEVTIEIDPGEESGDESGDDG